MLFEFKGRIKKVEKTQTFTSGFQKRTITVDEDGAKYPNCVPFVLKKDNVTLADDLREGDEVTVKFRIEGRDWDGPKGTMHFVDLVAISLNGGSAKSGGRGRKEVPPPAASGADELPNADASIDDMPF